MFHENRFPFHDISTSPLIDPFPHVVLPIVSDFSAYLLTPYNYPHVPTANDAMSQTNIGLSDASPDLQNNEPSVAPTDTSHTDISQDPPTDVNSSDDIIDDSRASTLGPLQPSVIPESVPLSTDQGTSVAIPPPLRRSLRASKAPFLSQGLSLCSFKW